MAGSRGRDADESCATLDVSRYDIPGRRDLWVQGEHQDGAKGMGGPQRGVLLARGVFFVLSVVVAS